MVYKILVAEDEFIIARSIQDSLKRLGYAVISVVSTGEEAVESALRLRPDLVLMDIRLKGTIDGVQAAQRIQTGLNIPVVYLTAHSDPETLKRVVHSQAYGFLTKPFSDQSIKEALEKGLARHQQKQNRLRRGPVTSETDM